MRKGLSLHIGVRTTDPEHYKGTSYPKLRGCELDARAMQNLAWQKGYDASVLLIDSDATFGAVEGNVRCAIRDLVEGDTFLWTFSGHGAQLPSGVGDRGYNEGMVLYDYVMLDDHINVLLRRFKPGVRVILVADSCHSGTIFEHTPTRGRLLPDPAVGNYPSEPVYLNKILIRRVVEEHHARFIDHYQEVMERFTRECRDEEVPAGISADVVVLSATNELMRAADTSRGGVFTLLLLDVLAGRGIPSRQPFTGPYMELKYLIHGLVENDQIPDVVHLGPHSEDDSYPFFLGPPFSLNH